jgi:hypothetical protein
MSYLLRTGLAMEDAGPCSAQPVLSRAELDIIDALPDRAHENTREAFCELEAGQPGLHLAVARMSRLRIKVSGCMRSTAGAGEFCAIRSCLATAARHGLSGLDALTRAFQGSPWIPGIG